VKRVRCQSQLHPICFNWLRIRASYCVFPLPDALDQLVAAQIVPRLVFFSSQAAFDHRLRRDARVIGAGHPQRRTALHPLHADQDVLQRIVQRVAQMQRPGDVRRRDHDAKRLAVRLAARHGRSPCSSHQAYRRSRASA
jgi:hypothetical protein